MLLVRIPLATPATHRNPCTHFCSFAAPHCVVDCASVIPSQQKWREAIKKSGRVIEGVLPANIHTHTQSQPDVSYINCTPLSTKSSAQVSCVIRRWQFHKFVELTNGSHFPLFDQYCAYLTILQFVQCCGSVTRNFFGLVKSGFDTSSDLSDIRWKEYNIILLWSNASFNYIYVSIENLKIHAAALYVIYGH
jgi:hypothetical protein